MWGLSAQPILQSWASPEEASTHKLLKSFMRHHIVFFVLLPLGRTTHPYQRGGEVVRCCMAAVCCSTRLRRGLCSCRISSSSLLEASSSGSGPALCGAAYRHMLALSASFTIESLFGLTIPCGQLLPENNTCNG